MDLSPKRFFEQMLPSLVLASFHDFLEREGSLAFDVAGAGQWTLTFGSDEPVSSGLKPGAALTLTFCRGAFEKFIDGSLDIGEAVGAKQITARGSDFTMIEAFARLLRPPASDLGWDVTTVG